MSWSSCVSVRPAPSGSPEDSVTTGMASAGGGGPGGEVQNTADGVVHRRGGVEPASGGVAEPPPWAFEEAGHAAQGIPFAGWVEVDAEPVALQDVRVARESLVIHVHLRWD